MWSLATTTPLHGIEHVQREQTGLLYTTFRTELSSATSKRPSCNLVLPLANQFWKPKGELRKCNDHDEHDKHERYQRQHAYTNAMDLNARVRSRTNKVDPYRR